MKRLFSLMLALMMVLSLAALVSADENDLAADGWSVTNDNFIGWTKEGDEIVFSTESHNAVELMFFSNKCQVYKTRACDFDDTKIQLYFI